ncbi:hypothetical protein FDECE_17600 [Fusarium decemcellulare]|nr:hypothetical protein FDECE_17600 [Fusarium decemcellulare]
MEKQRGEIGLESPEEKLPRIELKLWTQAFGPSDRGSRPNLAGLSPRGEGWDCVTQTGSWERRDALDSGRTTLLPYEIRWLGYRGQEHVNSNFRQVEMQPKGPWSGMLSSRGATPSDAFSPAPEPSVTKSLEITPDE